jgi:DNA repair protein RecN (Recombination protein N)
MQRHRVESVSDLISIRENLRQKVNEIILSDDKLEAMDERIHDLKKQLAAGAREISENRKRVSETLESRMGELLKSLGMPNGRFAVSIKTLNDFSSSGLDYVDFLFSANKQVAPENLNRVASGGELSRVMLSLKSLLTDNSKLPTIFFDEIDSGVSGEVATKVGEILAAMGAKMQVINITHLPQVAAHGNMHYHVYKEESGDSTITHIKLLDKKQRLNEIARLLSGNEITDASLQNARELINGA